MTWTEANSHARRLWQKWVSGRPEYGLNGYIGERIRPLIIVSMTWAKSTIRCFKRLDWHRTGKSGATPACIREVKGEIDSFTGISQQR